MQDIYYSCKVTKRFISNKQAKVKSKKYNKQLTPSSRSRGDQHSVTTREQTIDFTQCFDNSNKYIKFVGETTSV